VIIKTEQCPLQKDIEVTIKYPEKTKAVESIVSFLNSIEMKLECYSEDSAKLLNVSDIYYIESFDKKTLVFCENENYQTKYRLYQLNEKLAKNNFVQTFCQYLKNQKRCKRDKRTAEKTQRKYRYCNLAVNSCNWVNFVIINCFYVLHSE